jgi:hypothetical protein
MNLFKVWTAKILLKVFEITKAEKELFIEPVRITGRRIVEFQF